MICTRCKHILIHKNIQTNAHISNSSSSPPISYAPQATCIDETDVVVWGRMANAAVQLDDLRLARHALESALSVSSGHWPSIDKLCTVCAD